MKSTQINASSVVAHGTPRPRYIWGANSGNTAPAIDRMKVLTAMAEFEYGP